MAVRVKNLFITGTPGVGKTTLIKECVSPFRAYVGGFFTEEIREGGERKGFLLKTLDGKSGILASKGFSSRVRLNKYGIDLTVLEGMGVASVRQALQEKKVVVVDEIGTMEMLSPIFREVMADAMAHEKPLLASIRRRAEPFTSQIKKMSETSLLQLDRQNFLEVKGQVRSWLEAQCQD